MLFAIIRLDDKEVITKREFDSWFDANMYCDEFMKRGIFAYPLNLDDLFEGFVRNLSYKDLSLEYKFLTMENILSYKIDFSVMSEDLKAIVVKKVRSMIRKFKEDIIYISFSMYKSDHLYEESPFDFTNGLFFIDKIYLRIFNYLYQNQHE